MKRTYIFLLGLGVFLIAASPLLASTVIPYVIPSSEKKNPDCQYICTGCYSQLKDDSPPHPAGMEHTVTDSVLSVTITCVTSNDDGEMMSFDWLSNIPVSAVIVKTKDANVYIYDPPVTSDTGLVTPGQNAVSHITFCYSVPQITVTVTWGATLGITQPMIAEWADHPVEFTKPFGELTVRVRATIRYALQIYYTVGGLSDFSPPFGATPLSFEYPSGNWTSIPSEEEGTTQTLPLPSGVGTNEYTYAMRIDLAQLGTADQTAGDSITFEVHVMATGDM